MMRGPLSRSHRDRRAWPPRVLASPDARSPGPGRAAPPSASTSRSSARGAAVPALDAKAFTVAVNGAPREVLAAEPAVAPAAGRTFVPGHRRDERLPRRRGLAAHRRVGDRRSAGTGRSAGRRAAAAGRGPSCRRPTTRRRSRRRWPRSPAGGRTISATSAWASARRWPFPRATRSRSPASPIAIAGCPRRCGRPRARRWCRPAADRAGATAGPASRPSSATSR